MIFHWVGKCIVDEMDQIFLSISIEMQTIDDESSWAS